MTSQERLLLIRVVDAIVKMNTQNPPTLSAADIQELQELAKDVDTNTNWLKKIRQGGS